MGSFTIIEAEHFDPFPLSIATARAAAATTTMRHLLHPRTMLGHIPARADGGNVLDLGRSDPITSERYRQQSAKSCVRTT